LTPAGNTLAIIVVVILGIASLALFFSGLIQRYRLLRLGREENRFDHIPRRISSLLLFAFGHWSLLKSVTRTDRAGISHFFIFWGLIIFSFGYLFFIFGAGFYEDFAVAVLGWSLSTALAFITDIFGVLALIAIVWGAIRRFIIRPERQSASLAYAYFMGTLGILLVTYFFMESFRIIAGEEASVLRFPVGLPLAYALGGIGLTKSGAEIWYTVLWWLDLAIIFGFLAHSRYSGQFHAVAAPFNIFLRNLRPKGVITPIDLETAKTFRVSTIDRLTWKQLLDGYACTECGKCQISCPAYLSGKLLNPKNIILDTKEHLLKHASTLLKKGAVQHGNFAGDVIPEEVIWDCTMCSTCEHECPVMIEQMHQIVDLRRHLVEQGRVSPNVVKALDSIRFLGNPWEQPQSARLDWAEGRTVNLIQDRGEVDVLYWVGCAGAYDPRSRDISLAMVRLLDEAGVNYALLGTEEKCCGDPARRMGEEGLFQTLALSNIEVLKKYSFKRIVTHCPHGFNTLKNEYPQFGGHFEVVHHSQFLMELIRAGRIRLQDEQELRLTFHDPCYLGRYNGIYDPARQVLQAPPKTTMIEMESNRSKAMCCGAGGGQFWIQSEKGRRIEDMRFEQVQELGVQVVATACPYCTIMLDTAAKIKEPTGAIKVMDIAELVVKALGQRV